MQNMISMVLSAKNDENVREKLIQINRQAILRSASSAAKRYVTESDDEWSVALYAFSRAVDVYTPEKGEFLPFAQMLIHRSLIDYYRSEARHAPEFSVAPEVMEGNGEEEETDPVYLAVAEASMQEEERTLREEILEANELFSSFGFSFYDLTACSPKQEKTRRECVLAVRYMMNPRERAEDFKQTARLPIREIRKATAQPKSQLCGVLRISDAEDSASLPLHSEHDFLCYHQPLFFSKCYEKPAWMVR